MQSPATYHDSDNPGGGTPTTGDDAATARWDTTVWAGRLSLFFLALVIFGIAYVHFRSDVNTTPFHPDESRWINRAHYLEDLLEPFGPTWNDYYLTRGQPPIGSYVMGAGLLAQGVDLDTNYAWEYRRAREWNVQNGMYPTPEEIRAGRMTNVFLGSVAVVVTFFAVRKLSNSIGGIVGAAILTFHPLQSWHNRLALADTALTLTLASTVLMTVLLLRKPGWFRALAVGILIGVGGANKLTPLALAFVMASVGAVLLVLAYLRNRAALLPDEPSTAAIPGLRHLGWMLVSTPLIAGAAFVASYPYLWSNPVANTLLLLDFRQNEMAEQARLYPRFAVETTIEAINRTWIRLSDTWSATDWVFRWLGQDELGDRLGPLDIVLAIIGSALLAWLATTRPLRSGHLVVGLLLLMQVGTIVISMRTDFERYYLPIVLAIAILAGTGVGIGSQVLASALQFRRQPSRERKMGFHPGSPSSDPRTGTSES